MVIDQAGNFYVAEYGENDRIQVFSPEGKWLRQWGGHGYEPGEFLRPRALAIDEQDRLYVADSCNHRIQVFDTQGKLLRDLGHAGRRARARCAIRTTWRSGRTTASMSASTATTGSRSSRSTASRWAPGAARAAGPGELYNPWALAVDRRGAVSVIDSNNHRVQRFRL